MARATPFIPATAGDLTPRWLTEQLRAHARLAHDVEVTGFELGAVGGGTALSGELVRVHLRYSGRPGAAPATVIAKFPTTHAQNRGLIENLDLYEREIDFYRTLADEMPIRVPRHYGSAFDPDPLPAAVKRVRNRLVERLPARGHAAITADVSTFLKPTTRRYALLIEDLGAGEVHDMVAPPAPDRLMIILEHLARLHARYWGDPSLPGRVDSGRVASQLPKLQRNVCIDRGLAACVERWPEMMGPGEAAMVLDAAERFPDDVARLNRRITLVHGDPRSDNMLFVDDQLVVLDWALPAHGDPGYDVGYLLCSSVEVADGRPLARKLAEHYLGALRVEGVEHSFVDLWESVEAVCRTQLVQNALSLLFFDAEYGDQQAYDYWFPRALAILGD